MKSHFKKRNEISFLWNESHSKKVKPYRSFAKYCRYISGVCVCVYIYIYIYIYIYTIICIIIYRCCAGYGTTQKRKYCLLESESTAASIAIESATNIDASKWVVSIGTTIQHATHFCLIVKILTLFLILPCLIFLPLMRKHVSCLADCRR